MKILGRRFSHNQKLEIQKKKMWKASNIQNILKL